MSHHFDSPTAIEDGRLNLCDLYVFPSSADLSTLILTVNPDAGRSTPTTFRPDALYEFVVNGDGATAQEQSFRLQFGEPGTDGRQRLTVRYADGPQEGVGGSLLGSGKTADTFSLTGGGSAWFGVTADPFWVMASPWHSSIRVWR